MAKIKAIDLPSPASSPEVIEMLRDLLVAAYNERIELFVYGFISSSGMEANGVLSPDNSSRQVDRLLDMLEDWAVDNEYPGFVLEDDDTGE